MTISQYSAKSLAILTILWIYVISPFMTLSLLNGTGVQAEYIENNGIAVNEQTESTESHTESIKAETMTPSPNISTLIPTPVPTQTILSTTAPEDSLKKEFEIQQATIETPNTSLEIPALIPTPTTTQTLLPSRALTNTLKTQETWKQTSKDSYTTTENVRLNKVYVIENLPGFAITFTKLPTPSKKVTVREITVPSTINGAKTSGVGYDVTSEMINGTFEYTLTLPKSDSDNAEILYSEDGSRYSSMSGEIVKNNTLSVEANHFTIFVVVNPNLAGNGNQSDDACLTSGGSSVTCYDTIQAAINASTTGDTVTIKNGTYTPTSTISVNKSITVTGESRGGVIISGSAMPASSYGIRVTASNVTLSNFTLQNAKSYGIKVEGVNDITIQNVTSKNNARTNIDFNGVDNMVVHNVTTTGTLFGVGIAVTDGNNGSFSQITTSSNAWGGMAFYTSHYFPPAGVSNMAITGTNSFGELIVYTTDGTGPFTGITFNAPSLYSITWSPQLTTYHASQSYFVLPQYFVRENNHTDNVAQVAVPILASEVRFTVTGIDTPFTATVVDTNTGDNSYNDDIYKVSGAAAGLQWWRVQKDLLGGRYTVTGEFKIQNTWYPITGSTTVTVIDTPWFSYVTPATTGLYFRPTDQFARLRIDDQYNQTNIVLFKIYDATTNLQVGGEYSIPRANCDTSQAGNYLVCDLMRDYPGSKPSLVDGTYYLRTQSNGASGSGIRYANTQSNVFTIDGTKPLLSDFMIDNSQPVYSNEIIASALASDNNGVNNVEFYLTYPRISDNVCDGNGTKLAQITKTSTDGDGRYRAIFDVSAYNALICVNAIAEDYANSHSTISKLSALVDNTLPTVNLVFPTIGILGTSFEAHFSEAVNETEAENPANYFLNNWPTASGSGDLAGDAIVNYDPVTKVSTITFSDPSWYVSPEQQWGVQNIHDLAGNLLAVSPYTEYSTPLITPITTDSGTDDSWHNTDVTITLNCNDGTLLVDASGCYKTFYSVDSSPYQEGSSLTITDEGVHTVLYYSTDHAGNYEVPKNTAFTVKIDKTAPIVTVPEDQIFDENSNGVYPYSFISTAYESELVPATILSSLIVTCTPDQAGFDYPVGTTLVECSATDRAGNIGTASFTVTVNNLVPTVSISAEENDDNSYLFTAAVLGGNAPYTYLWSNGCSGTGSTAETGSTPATYTCTVTVTDNDGDSASTSITRTVTTSETAVLAVQNEVLGENSGNNDTENKTETPQVLGERSCTNKVKLIGIMFVDTNKNDTYDTGEQLLSGVTGKIAYTAEGKEFTVDSFLSDNNGKWMSELCAGDYDVTVNSSSLPKGVTSSSEKHLVTVLGTQAETTLALAFLKADEHSNWMWLWIALLIIFVLAVIYYVYRKRREYLEARA